jgi:transcription elongation GreA/GreB family factor
MHETAKILFAQIIANKREEIERTEQARQVSLKDAQEAEGAMISRYDTFLEEAQYLAGGQNKRLLEAKTVLALLESLLQRDADVSNQVSIGSVVAIENIDTAERKLFLLVSEGAGGGVFLHPSYGGEKVSAISPSSPIGKALFGKGNGEEIECSVLKGAWEISEIQ